MITVKKRTKIYIPGIDGMIAKAIADSLSQDEQYSVIGTNRKEIDLLNFQEIELFFRENRPDIIVLAAAKRSEVVMLFLRNL